MRLDHDVDDRRQIYFDLVLSSLPEAMQHRLEIMMGTSTYEYQSDFARKYYGEGRDEGRAEGEARAVLAVLAARGLSLDPAQRDRIATCTDLHQLDIWVQRAALVSDADELFD